MLLTAHHQFYSIKELLMKSTDKKFQIENQPVDYHMIKKTILKNNPKKQCIANEYFVTSCNQGKAQII